MIVPFVRVSNAVTRSSSRSVLQPLMFSIPAGITQMEQQFSALWGRIWYAWSLMTCDLMHCEVEHSRVGRDLISSVLNPDMQSAADLAFGRCPATAGRGLPGAPGAVAHPAARNEPPELRIRSARPGALLR
jgi:hypothetical protein